MNIVTLLDMAASGNPDRIAVGRLRSTAEDAAPLSYLWEPPEGQSRRTLATRSAAVSSGALNDR